MLRKLCFVALPLLLIAICFSFGAATASAHSPGYGSHGCYHGSCYAPSYCAPSYCAPSYCAPTYCAPIQYSAPCCTSYDYCQPTYRCVVPTCHYRGCGF